MQTILSKVTVQYQNLEASSNSIYGGPFTGFTKKNQRGMYDPVKHLDGVFLAKIVNAF